MKGRVILFIVLIAINSSLFSQTPLNASVLGTWGQGNSTAMAIGGNYAFTNCGSRFIVVDVSLPGSPVIVGEITLSSEILGIKVKGNYAYVVDGPLGICVLDISNPTAPQLIGNTDTQGWARGLEIEGNYAYVADNDFGILIFDISNPSIPVLRGSFDTPGYAYQVKVQGDYAYVADHDKGVRIINISNPSSPNETGSYYIGEYEEMDGIAVAGNILYIAFVDGLIIADVSDKTHPVQIGAWYKEIVHGNSVELNAGYAYLNCGSDVSRVLNISSPTNPQVAGNIPSAFSISFSGEYAFVPGMKVFNISEPAHVVTEASLSFGGIVFGIAVRDTLAYLADWTGGLHIVNCSKLDNLHKIGSFDTPYTALNIAVSGDYAYVADSDSGLRIINVNNPYSPYGVAHYKIQGKALDVTLNGNYAFVAYGSAGMRILDINNPQAPLEAGYFDTQGQANEIEIKGNLAYIADGPDGIRIVDISNPAFPVETGYFDTPGISLGLAFSGNYLIVADGAGSILILDISNPVSPQLIWSYTEYEYYSGVSISGRYACFKTLYNGLNIFDIQDPYNPVKMGIYDKGGKRALAISGGLYFVDDNFGFSVLRVELPFGEDEDPSATNTLHPFFDDAGFHFTLLHDSRVILTLYDVIGNEVGILAREVFSSGECCISLDGSKLCTGIYLYKLQAGRKSYTGKIIKR